MKLTDILRLALGNFLRGRIRSLLTICSISIGVASVILILTLGDGSRAAISEQLDRIGLDGIMIYPKQIAISQGIALTGQDAYELAENIQGIDKSMPIMVRYGSYRIKNWQGNALVYGVDDTMRDVLKVDLLYGRMLNRIDVNAGKNVIVISSDFAEMVYRRKNIVGKSIRIYVGTNFEEYEIIGVVSSHKDGISQLLGDTLPQFFYVPYTSLMRLVKEDTVDEVVILSDDESVAAKAVSYLNRKYGNSNSFRFENINGIRDRIDNVIYLIAMFISAIAAIAIIVAGIGIMNTMMSQAIERKREIGIYLTLGATGRDIMLSFLAESAVLSAIGGILGIIVSVIPISVVSEITKIQFSLQLRHILIAEGISIFCGLLFGVSPAMRAASLNPIDAIRSE
ncbi:MAG: FtsX-like permease family protein [Clostridiales bacterium]|nr:FtsX-like permease family protein [Clostridiales bacterium]